MIMGQALYRKYRSKNLGEIVGQEHITVTLANALKSGKISHAYLLTGPRGVGKTSIARILAHEINGLPYDDEAHLDIIEIDAASNRRIDEIRDLRDRVNTAPAHAKYKVYIIDEVHMLTREAFNALLKTLEEPPAHVIFILATTEAHKLPETIVSRTQRYSFRPVPREQVVAHLKSIAVAEKISIDEGALELIAEHGEGSFRDSISLLDQAGNHDGKITRAVIEDMLGLAPDALLDNIIETIGERNADELVRTLDKVHNQGYEPAIMASQIAARFRWQLLNNQNTLNHDATLQLLHGLLGVPASRAPARLLELVLLKALYSFTGTVPNPAPQTKEPLADKPAPRPGKKPDELASPKTGKPQKAAETATAKPAKSKTSNQPLDVAALWQNTLATIKKQHNTLYGLARMAEPELAEPSDLTLRCAFKFHQKHLSESKNQRILTDTLETISGRQFQVRCIVSEQTTPTPAEAPTDLPPLEPMPPSNVETISNIFGGAELLES